jgi:glycosyltransferase involved in cell wall biosynthesis
VIDLEQVSELDKHRLIRHALATCQPSLNESFSIVMMESWLLGTPVLVHAECVVTREHVVQSGGGLYFANQDEFNAVLELMLKDQVLSHSLAAAGFRYVRERYNWDAVIKRFDRALGEIFSQSDRLVSVEVS